MSLFRWFQGFFDLKVGGELNKRIHSLLADPSYGGQFIASSINGLLYSFPKEREIVSEVATAFKSLYQRMDSQFYEFLFQVLDSFTVAQMPAKHTFQQKLCKAMNEKDVMRLSSCLQDFACDFARRNASLTR